MDSLTLDPYEQQLLSVFDSCDRDNLGSLDHDGLIQLCQTLHLEEQSNDLIQSLLNDPKRSRASFDDFKDALLTLLGNMQLHNNEKGSPDREVSPRFVYGSKKYGRRSRPNIEDHNDLNKVTSVQRSNSQSDVSNSKKRKTNKLKRCTSLPGQQHVKIVDNFQSNEMICTEEMLKEAWMKLGVGKDGYLNQNELILVCDAIGLDQLAKGVIRQLSLEYDHRISFQELLEALQLDETWTEVLNVPPQNHQNEEIALSNEIFPDSRTFQFLTLGPDGNGVVNAETLIEMWEQVGISGPKELVHELGFNTREICIIELASVLEKEMKVMQDGEKVQNPHVSLLNANLTLYQSEIKCLKSVLEQLQAEREKLKYDVFEANNRADLLAHEVDDNHLRMERNCQKQIKLMEQRHADILKEITKQYAGDKETATATNQALEAKIVRLEDEVIKLKHDLLVAQKYAAGIEGENQSLAAQIAELENVRATLGEQIAELQCEKQKYDEMEMEQIEPLLAKLAGVRLENAALRDRNDEMVAEIENLSGEVAAMRAKISATTATSVCNTLDESMDSATTVCENVGLGAKRRSDDDCCSSSGSSSKDGRFGRADISPRLGKVRKFQQDLEIVPPFTSNESGFEADVDDADEVIRLQAKIAFLEQLLHAHSIPIPGDNASSPPSRLKLTSPP